MTLHPKPQIHRDNLHYLYRLFDSEGRLIYIGCTYDPEARIKQHRKRFWWGDQIARVKLTIHPNKAAVHERERAAIRDELPRWNIGGKWAYRKSWSVENFDDYIKAIQLSPEHMTGARSERIEKAKALRQQRLELAA